MDLPTIPDRSRGTGNQDLTLTPKNTHIHCDSFRANTPPHINTPNHSHSPPPPQTPHTPASTAPNACTVDEPSYTRVAVHTAKCTECDKRNMDTMRRCPGCTFQVCQPCYEKRQRQGKGLVHGNMPSPEETGVATPSGAGARASRKKPVGSAAKAKSSEEVDEDESKECADSAIKEGKHTPFVPKPTAGKRSRGRSCVKDSEAEESSEGEGELNHAYPTPSKRHQTLSFAESALATATRAPPTTRAASRSNPNIAYPAPLTPQLETARPRVPVTYSREDYPYDDLLYQNCIVGYDEPLLARREPVIHNPAGRIPAIMQRDGRRRPTADEIYQNIQKKVREKLEKMEADKLAAGDTTPSVPAPHVTPDYKTATTVRDFVEKEAKRHQEANNLGEDDSKTLLRIMLIEAMGWGKKTFKKQEYGPRRLLLPGLNLRLDRIPNKYTTELGVLMDGVAEHALHELDEAATLSATSPPPPSG
ncbi:hypothetical protein COCCADRAFT_41592 [Bipolaris zeicola 26-R-13]|uniref:Uncharacterized protein n=1 Tax=Cochliobolus carbonum (strain 26-R-13) TaxID=930089 RepID=W6XQ95_COCC2|nr:uncharacterized protein COCCADRAFT_41592 [Bipolaris zeicola 26-R-13]EUC27753.1 hypothetical protein COCCADRAFT_41592 [Bipolaris zeicola 26-R-13]